MRVVSPLPAFVQPQVTTRPLLIYVSGSTFGTVVLLHGRGLFCVTTGHSSPSRGCHAPLNTEWIYNAVRVSGQWNLPLPIDKHTDQPSATLLLLLRC